MGAALAAHLARAGRRVALLGTLYDAEALAAVRGATAHPALGVALPAGVAAVDPGDWAASLREAEIVTLAVSTAGIAATVAEAAEHASPAALWAIATKGWEEATLRSAATVAADALGDPKRVVALVGPSLAGEIAAGSPTALVAASTDPSAAARVAAMFAAPGLRVYTSPDLAGVEVGAALKNVVAIAAGMCDGLAEREGRRWSNAKAFVFSRGLVEMARCALALGGRVETALGLTGAGDLFVTCEGGRNGRFGRLVGAGATPEEALEQMRTTVEGYANGRAAAALGERHRLDLPVVRAVCSVLYEGRAPAEAIGSLFEGAVEDELGS